jgi:hypothetical protein
MGRKFGYVSNEKNQNKQVVPQDNRGRIAEFYQILDETPKKKVKNNFLFIFFQ